MTQLALFPPPARAEQLHLFALDHHQEIRMPTPSTTPTPARRPNLAARLAARLRRPRKPRTSVHTPSGPWTFPSSTTELVDADLVVIRSALTMYAAEQYRRGAFPAAEAAELVLRKVQR